MKKIRILLLAVAAVLLAMPCHAQQTDSTQVTNQGEPISLTSSNGSSAGAALLGLYTQFKADGKLDITNTKNIQNLLMLASNIKGLGKISDTASFLSGLISGSGSLVNNNNSSSVLGSLVNVSNLDLSSLSKTVTTAAASSLASKLLSKIKPATAQTEAPADGNVNSAVSTLTSLFKVL